MSTDERTMVELAEPAGVARRSARRKGPARPRKWTRPTDRARPATESSEVPLGENEIEEAISAADIQFRKVQQEIRRRIAERAEAARLAHLAADERREAAVSALQSLAHANDEKRRPVRDENENEEEALESDLFARREPAEESAWPTPRVTAGFLLFTSLCTAASAIVVNGLVTGTWPLIDVFSDRQSAQTPAMTIVAEQPAPLLPAGPPEATRPAEMAIPVQKPTKAASSAPQAVSAETARAIQSWALTFARPAPAGPSPAANPRATPAPDGAAIRATPAPSPSLPDSASREPEETAGGQPAEQVMIMPAATVAEQITAPGASVSASYGAVELENAPPPVPAEAADQAPRPRIEAGLQPPAPVERESQPGVVSPADQLVASGQTYLSHGDIAAARLYFERAAELGDIRALIGLARTYDPVIFEQLGVRGMQPDAEMAMQYYLRARAAGSPDALAGIDALALYFGQ